MKKGFFTASLTFGAALLLGDAGVSAAPCDNAPAGDGVTAYCGIAAPEDLVALDHRYLTIGSMTPDLQLYLIDTSEDVLLPMTTVLAPVTAEENWGEADCAAPASMVIHGLDVGMRRDGSQQLLAVNHGDRESVEFFEVFRSPDAPPALRWRGCVIAPDNAQFNDVAALPDGGFLATDPITASWQLPRMLLGTVGVDTGRVYRWRPEIGYEAVPHTEGAYPNGILLALDGETFFLNLYLDGVVQQHDLESGEILGSVEIEKPDNSSWASSGELLVASHGASVFSLLAAIASEPSARNSIPYKIVAINPTDFSKRVVHEGKTDHLGGGTVAQQLGDDLYIGAFKGDRVLKLSGVAPEGRRSIKAVGEQNGAF